MPSAEMLLDDLRSAGLVIRRTRTGLEVQPSSLLTDAWREAIRQAKREIDDLLSISAAEEEELRHLLGVLCGRDHPDFQEALAAALANPQVHLRGLRMSAEIEGLI